jgi:serine/threonine protein kinase
MAETVAGRYRLHERIAVSEMSEVWEADDTELGRRVVLKLLGRGADEERFRREAQAAAGLAHPNICRLFDFGETDGRLFIVFELLRGGSLEDRLEAGRPLPDAETARIAGEVAAALGYAHAQGVVHRDVKAANVLFDEEGTAKLADFGIARITGEPTLTEAGTVVGTAAYISPEQATGDAVGPATDVYSFGVLLYRMLTGRLPFEAPAALEVAAMHATQEPPPVASLRPDAPPGLERLAMRALAKRPDNRPADGNALLAELTQVVEEETQVLAPVAARRGIRPRYVAAGAGLALLALVGAALAVLAAPEPSQAPVTGPTRGNTSRPTTTSPSTESAPSTTAPTRTATTTPTTRGTTTTPAEPPPPPPPPSPTTPPPPPPTTTETVPTETVPTDTTTTATTTTSG